MHTLPLGDVREGLLCNAMNSMMPNNGRPSGNCNSSSSCMLLHELQQKEAMNNGNDDDRMNTHHPLIYDELTYYAKEMNLWSEQKTGYQVNDVIELVRVYQEDTLQLTEYDFEYGITCPDDDMYDWLFQYTVNSEELLFPSEQQQEDGNRTEITIMEHFQSMKHKFCEINAKTVLSLSEEWRQFFQSL